MSENVNTGCISDDSNIIINYFIFKYFDKAAVGWMIGKAFSL